MLKKKQTASQVRAKLDMRRFLRKTNWADLWDEFHTTLDKSGLPKYKTIKHFASEQAENSEQLRFMLYYLGPKENPDPDEAARYPFAQPQDWKKRRETGGWYTDENIEALSKGIAAKMNALEALSEAGNNITLRAFVRISNLMRQLDNAFQGRFFVDTDEFHNNIARAEAYLRLYNRILNMIGTAQDLYAKSRGINFDDMEGLAHILTASATMAKQVGDSTSRADKALGALMQMTLLKAAEYDLPLPEDAKEKIAEVIQDQPIPKKKLH